MPAISYMATQPILPAAVVHSKLTTASLPPLLTTEAVVDRLVQVITNYLLTSSPGDQFFDVGRGFLQSQVQSHVERNVPLELSVDFLSR